MPWSAGVFSRLYNFVQDAANGIKILATKQDAEWVNVVGGLNNTLTRDGTTSTADIDWGGKQINNLADGVADDDAATVRQVSSGEWVDEQTPVSFATGTTFKVLGVDATVKYHLGRRLKSTNTAGTKYSTVITSSYSAPDTTVTVVTDSGALDSGFTALQFGIISFVNSSLPMPTTALRVDNTVGTGTIAVSTLVKVPFNSIVTDYLNEYSTGTHKWTAAMPTGIYNIAGSILFAFGSTGGLCEVFVVVNGATATPVLWVAIPGTGITILPYSIVAALSVSDTIEIYVRTSVGLTSIGQQVGGVTSTFLTMGRMS